MDRTTRPPHHPPPILPESYRGRIVSGSRKPKESEPEPEPEPVTEPEPEPEPTDPEPEPEPGTEPGRIDSTTLEDPHVELQKIGTQNSNDQTGSGEKHTEHKVWIGNPGRNGENGADEDGNFHRDVEHGPIKALVKVQG